MTKFWLEGNEVKGDMDLSIFSDAQMKEIRLGLMKIPCNLPKKMDL